MRPTAFGDSNVIWHDDYAGKNEKAHNAGCFLRDGRGCGRRGRACTLPVGVDDSHTRKLGSYINRGPFGDAVAYPMPELPLLVVCKGTSDLKGQPNYR